jgi:hypothetical protein
MELLSEAIASRNIVVWILLVVLLIFFLKLLTFVGKGIVLLALVVGGLFLLANLFPVLLEPLIDFVQGGWLGDNSGNQSW